MAFTRPLSFVFSFHLGNNHLSALAVRFDVRKVGEDILSTQSPLVEHARCISSTDQTNSSPNPHGIFGVRRNTRMQGGTCTCVSTSFLNPHVKSLPWKRLVCRVRTCLADMMQLIRRLEDAFEGDGHLTIKTEPIGMNSTNFSWIVPTSSVEPDCVRVHLKL